MSVKRIQFSAALGVLVLAAALSLGSATFAAPAQATSPWWGLTSTSRPTNLAPGSQGVVVATAANLGDANASGPVTITDRLPAGLTVANARAVGFRSRSFSVTGTNDLGPKGAYASLDLCAVAAQEVSCTYRDSEELEALGAPPAEVAEFGRLRPYVGHLEMRITVNVSSEAPIGKLQNEVSVSGGGGRPGSVRRPLEISEEAAPFGIEDFELRPEAEGGAPDAQAGSHPFQLTNVLDFTQTAEGTGEEVEPVELPRDLTFALPPGVLGNSTAVARCTASQFSKQDNSLPVIGDECPPDTQIGVATNTFFLKGQIGNVSEPVPLFNLVPEAGEPARFGFVAGGVFPIILDTSVRDGDGENYGVTVSVDNITQLSDLLANEVTFWGTPGDPRHDASRGYRCLDGTVGCVAAKETHPNAFLLMPTSCPANPATEPFSASMTARSWLEPAGGSYPEATYDLSDELGDPLGLDGCNQLPFAPRAEAEPTSDAATTSSGLSFDLYVNDEGLTSPEGLAQSQLEKAVVSLPVGMTANPSVAAGLSACTLAQYESEDLASTPGTGCPNESDIGTVEVESPLVTQKIDGSVFLAKQDENPFGSLIGLYVVAKNPELGVMIRVAGKVEPNPVTGQLVTTFEGIPQLPFSHFHFAFRQGQRAPLATPAACGTYTTNAELTPYSAPDAPLHDTATFSITTGPEGAPCPAGGTPPFSPAVTTGLVNNSAGSYSPMYLQVTRKDTEQEITRVSAQLPSGLTANLSGVPFCPDADIEAAKSKSGASEEAEPSCPAASQIGHTEVGVGVGGTLAWSAGRLYLAGPYNGAPFSVVALNSAKVGPFDLGTVVVREALSINPETAVVTIDAKASDPIPHILDGIVIHARDIRVYVDRPDFTLNPTSCNPTKFSVTVDGAGADPANPADQAPVTVNDPFQDADCANLAFKPSFKVTTSGKTSRANGASLSVKLAYPNAPQGTQTNIRSVKVDLPRQLPSRLTTLQHACTEQQFAANPAGCPAASRVGTAKAITPILPEALTGPAYFVSYGAAKFPELVVVLQGYGVTIELHGETFISNGITSSTFRTVPDQPVTSFELTLPEGPYSALGAPLGLCNLTKTTTVKSKVKVKSKGHTRTVTRKLHKSVPIKLTMPSSFTGQNGVTIKQNTPIEVSQCPTVKKKTSTPKRSKK
ncbi:MAG TPA: hypothetical protein VGP18_01315 [Solirubrobacteraceae bacterium]|jgi:hypothetical protein|nr:hypothetical protein [Solirubrobacteraceae bacterium]